MPPAVDDSAVRTVSIRDDRRILHIALFDGRALVLTADRLRMQCRCATCSRARIDGTFAPPAQGVEIEHVTPIGHYGLNIAFSDGHARGIFPFAYLAELAPFEAEPGNTPVEASGVIS